MSRGFFLTIRNVFLAWISWNECARGAWRAQSFCLRYNPSRIANIMNKALLRAKPTVCTLSFAAETLYVRKGNPP